MTTSPAASGPAPLSSDNPFAQEWATPFGLPPFSAIKIEHFKPAYLEAMQSHRAEIDAIAAQEAAPSFENTILAMEKAGAQLSRISRVFGLLSGTMVTPELQALQGEMTGPLTQHGLYCAQHPEIFKRITAVYNQRADLKPAARRLVDDYFRSYELSGATLNEADQALFRDLSEKQAQSSRKFGENLVNEAKAKVLYLDKGDLDGLPPSVVSAMAGAASARGQEGKYAVTLMAESYGEFMKYSSRRDLREKLYDVYSQRGNAGDQYDNKALVEDIVDLRRQKAKLLGYPSYAHMAVENNMAKTPGAVLELLTSLWTPARARYLEERAELQAAAAADGVTGPLRPWDTAYYAEKLRQSKYAFDAEELKPYCSIESMRAAAFALAEKTLGVTFVPRKDIEAHHPDATVFEAQTAKGKAIGLFITDYYARDSKRAGAWMSSLRSQNGLTGDLPIIYNVANFSKPEDGKPSLQTFSNGVTLAHELGHGLHGLLSKTEYPSQSGTAVLRDFVEFPSQFLETLFQHPSVMAQYLRHHATGEPMPQTLIDKVKKADTFMEGHATLRQLCFGITDLEVYLRPAGEKFNAATFEAEVLKNYGLPDEMERAPSFPSFGHIFSGGYAAGYYVYLWADVLSADGAAQFDANPFDSKLGAKVARHIYATGDSRHPMDSYKKAFGRKPTRDALLKAKGFA